MGDKLDMPDSFEEAERFQRLFVEPMVQAVRTEMQQHVQQVTDFVTKTNATVSGFDGRIRKLEGDQRKALVGWGVYATIVGVALTTAWKWVASKIHFG